MGDLESLGSIQTQLPFISSPQALPVDLLSRPDAYVEPLDDPPRFRLSVNPSMSDVVDTATPPKHVTEPLSENISAGKNTYVYDAHTYHTKVPPQGIAPIIEHYTEPGQTVLDVFSGSGMTGVAALRTQRIPVLTDLSPAATFIAYNLLTPIPADRYLHAVEAVLATSYDLELALYGTNCPACGVRTPCLYTVWSYRTLCSHCGQDFQLWDVARDEHPRVRDSKILTEFDCPNCGGHLKKRELSRTHREPVQIGSGHCRRGRKEQKASPTTADLSHLDALTYESIPEDLWFPTKPFPEGINTRQPRAHGITSIDKAYTPRGLWAMAHLWDIARRWPDADIRSKLLFTLTSLYQRVTYFSEFRFWGGSGNMAHYNVPFIMNEQNVFRVFERKAKTISWYFDATDIDSRSSFRLSTQSACDLSNLPDESIDFAFTDPPFGGNINYSEMNFLWESWLGRLTDPTDEAIINKVQDKEVDDYQELLTSAFLEVRRVLKDDAWFVIMFHNSAKYVWNAVQNAIAAAGFIVRAAQTFDKQHGTFKQFVSDNAVGYDLVLHCRQAEPSASALTPENMPTTQIKLFVESALSRDPASYIASFKHVKRESEIDYRRLYSEWLSDTVNTGDVQLGFDDFRSVARRVLLAGKFDLPDSDLETD